VIDTNNFFNGASGILTTMAGLSVAAERVTETIKQWLFPVAGTKLSAARYAALMQFIAIVSGVLVVAVSGVNPLEIHLHGNGSQWTDGGYWANLLITGILVSGGSAFWNHLLDILKATAVQKTQAANSATADPAKLIPG
jgi:drug/metabolite transporter (DMT)-like permease